MARSKIVQRIARALQEGDPLDGLERALPGSDLQSLMLHVYRERGLRRSPAELLEQALRVSMLGNSSVDPRRLIRIEQRALDCAHGFEAVDLAPVAPLGLNAVLGQIDQNSCLATVRGTEVIADPTTAQALECARRRRAGARGELRLCSRGRMLRLQPLQSPEHTPHFALFALASAGVADPSRPFEHPHLVEHLGVYLELLAGLAELGLALREIAVSIADTQSCEARIEGVRARVFPALAQRFPRVSLQIDRERTRALGYYRGLCLAIDVTTAEGRRLNLVDGGFTDWTQRLLSNARERLLVSGIGIDLLARLIPEA